jgi:hypothetical protein
MTGGVAQAVENLLCKHKALSSNPIPQKKKMVFIKRSILFCGI